MFPQSCWVLLRPKPIPSIFVKRTGAHLGVPHFERSGAQLRTYIHIDVYQATCLRHLRLL